MPALYKKEPNHACGMEVRILKWSHVNILLTSPWSHLAWREAQLSGLGGIVPTDSVLLGLSFFFFFLYTSKAQESIYTLGVSMRL